MNDKLPDDKEPTVLVNKFTEMSFQKTDSNAIDISD